MAGAVRACQTCHGALLARQDDGSGRHRDPCPEPGDFAVYAARRRAAMPNLARLHADLAAGRMLVEHLTETNDERDEGDGA